MKLCYEKISATAEVFPSINLNADLTDAEELKRIYFAMEYYIRKLKGMSSGDSRVEFLLIDGVHAVIEVN